MNIPTFRTEQLASPGTEVRGACVVSMSGRASDTPANICGTELARLVTNSSGLSCSEVSETLAALPPNMINMLDHPQGWIALAGFVLTAFGVEARAPIVTVH